jgi:hypothetical protein
VPHLDLAPVRIVALSIFEDGGDLVVAVFEDVGGDLEAISHLALDRITAAIELRSEVLDDHTAGRRQDVGGRR